MPLFNPWSPHNPSEFQMPPSRSTKYKSQSSFGTPFRQWSDSQKSLPHSPPVPINSNDSMDIEPFSPSTLAVKTTPTGCKAVKLFWTAELEKAALELYIQAKHIAWLPWDSRKNSRTWIWMERNVNLNTIRYFSLFFHSFFVVFFWFFFSHCPADLSCTQGFKKDYDTFSELKKDSCFRWNDETWEVTTPDQVWNNYLMVFIHASEFDDLDQLSVINVFYSERKAAIYISSQRRELCIQ
ncbi:uncharacterized protein VP01_5422g1 [Puccinia sorghi]|uniref:Uncharacterized protein n=1 Tax=Puccinia sorghi TaxID=27349 RepID=A0A0L6UJQ0_9BASI|nr:uncharacterized protein VP01_5422g1 [Puccinia sorghi]